MRTTAAMSKVDGLRALLGGTVLAATVAFLIGVWLGRGFTLDGGSMAPGLLGPHASLECPMCELPFIVGVEDGSTFDRPATCPNCGSPVERHPAAIADGDGVLVDRRAFQFRAPRRYEVVSLCEPNKASQLCVKRVVGLPRERVAIRAGDVFINGRISRKSLAEQQAVALQVYDNSFQPSPDSAAPARWQPEQNASRWRTTGSGFSTAAAASADLAIADEQPPPAAVDWLSYRHLVRVGDSAEFIESPVLDTQAYNQTRPVADPHEVRDLALAVDLQAEGPGAILLRALDAGLRRGPHPGPHPREEEESGASNPLQQFVCQLDVTTGQCELRCAARLLASESAPPLADGQIHSLYFAMFDRQVLLAIDGQVVFEHALDEPLDESDQSPVGVASALSRPFAIASDCVALRITGLRIERDVYYTSVGAGGDGLPDTAETQLALDEFFVLSDNSRLGLDSRYPSFGPAVSFNLFVGKPLAAYSRSPRVPSWWGGIQVPAPWRIRYIR